jgi:hypothetical protein
VLAWPNGPLTASCDTDTVLEFELDAVTVCAGLADPVSVLPKVRLDGERSARCPCRWRR